MGNQREGIEIPDLQTLNQKTPIWGRDEKLTRELPITTSKTNLGTEQSVTLSMRIATERGKNTRQGNQVKASRTPCGGKFEEQQGHAAGTVMWCDHVGSRGTLVTHLSLEDMVRERRSKDPRTEERETVQIRVINYCLQRAWCGKRWMTTQGILLKSLPTQLTVSFHVA